MSQAYLFVTQNHENRIKNREYIPACVTKLRNSGEQMGGGDIKLESYRNKKGDWIALYINTWWRDTNQ
jgi:hypothetical protein